MLGRSACRTTITEVYPTAGTCGRRRRLGLRIGPTSKYVNRLDRPRRHHRHGARRRRPAHRQHDHHADPRLALPLPMTVTPVCRLTVRRLVLTPASETGAGAHSAVDRRCPDGAIAARCSAAGTSRAPDWARRCRQLAASSDPWYAPSEYLWRPDLRGYAAVEERRPLLSWATLSASLTRQPRISSVRSLLLGAFGRDCHSDSGRRPSATNNEGSIAPPHFYRAGVSSLMRSGIPPVLVALRSPSRGSLRCDHRHPRGGCAGACRRLRGPICEAAGGNGLVDASSARSRSGRGGVSSLASDVADAHSIRCSG